MNVSKQALNSFFESIPMQKMVRGGVEDTRLEAKDTKKIQGQGQECSRPRTKDTIASALQKKKKGLPKNFSGNLHKKTFFKKFFKRSTKF